MHNNNCVKKNLKENVYTIVSEMPKNSKSTPASTASTAAPAPASTAETTAPVVSKRGKKAAAAASASVVEETVISTAPVVETSLATATESEEVVADTSDISAILKLAADYEAKVAEFGALYNSLKSDFKSYRKKVERKLKDNEKLQAKRKKKAGNRQPSGFVKPTKISDELAKFLDKPIGTEMARTVVTREINKYINDHHLKDKDNGRKINPDAKLRALLKIQATDDLTYFNLQTYMAPHFQKSVKSSVAASEKDSAV